MDIYSLKKRETDGEGVSQEYGIKSYNRWSYTPF